MKTTISLGRKLPSDAAMSPFSWLYVINLRFKYFIEIIIKIVQYGPKQRIKNIIIQCYKNKTIQLIVSCPYVSS